MGKHLKSSMIAFFSAHPYAHYAYYKNSSRPTSSRPTNRAMPYILEIFDCNQEHRRDFKNSDSKPLHHPQIILKRPQYKKVRSYYIFCNIVIYSLSQILSQIVFFTQEDILMKTTVKSLYLLIYVFLNFFLVYKFSHFETM